MKTTTQTYFSNCTTLDTLTKERNRLAKLYHPDLGGDLRVMQEINAQFEQAKKQLAAPAQNRVHPVPKPSQTGPKPPWEWGNEEFTDWFDNIINRAERERRQRQSWAARETPKQWAARKEKERLAEEREARAEELREAFEDVQKAAKRGMFAYCHTHYRSGEFFIVGGKTYPYKEWLKAHGFKWMPGSQNWHYNKRPTNRKDYENDYYDD